MKQVVRAFIYNKDTKKYLLVKHIGSDVWTLPGGHIDAGETPHEALKREILEEFNLEIKIKGEKTKLDFENIMPVPFPLSIYKIEFISKKYGLTKKLEYIFKAKVKSETLENFEVDESEISEYDWMTSKQILSLNKKEIYGQFRKLLKIIEK